MEPRRRTALEDTIRLDPEGNWYQGEFPILHERTVQYLFKNIAAGDDGRYYLTGEDKPIFIRVEDVPFWITKVERTIAGYLVTLTDGSIELLDLDTLWSGKKNALYVLVKGRKYPAKFFRPPYYEIAKDIQQKGGAFHLLFGGKKFPISKTPPIQLKKQPKEKSPKRPRKSTKRKKPAKAKKGPKKKMKKAAKRKKK